MLEDNLQQTGIEPQETAENPLGAEFGTVGDVSESKETEKIAEPSMDEIAALQHESIMQSAKPPSQDELSSVRVKEFDQLGMSSQQSASNGIDMLLDVTLPISIELGRTAMSIQDILGLGPGSIVELNKLAGEPVDLLVNEKLIAKGEVVVVDENFGIRITSMVSQQDRIKSLR
jgi:flagellar motor switch protein FliN/FliY